MRSAKTFTFPNASTSNFMVFMVLIVFMVSKTELIESDLLPYRQYFFKKETSALRSSKIKIRLAASFGFELDNSIFLPLFFITMKSTKGMKNPSLNASLSLFSRKEKQQFLYVKKNALWRPFEDRIKALII